MQTSGLMIGHFEPLHLGHMRSILHAAGIVETLHIVIIAHWQPNPKFPVSLQDKARWLQMACQDLPFIHIHICDDFLFPILDTLEDKSHDSINDDICAFNAKLDYILTKFNLPADSHLFVSEHHLFTYPAIQSALNVSIETTPWHEQFNSASAYYDPIAHWDVIHPEARGDYTRTVAIVGGESSGKTTLVHKLANYYGADFALEMGRLYVGSDLGGSEIGLQYSDYAPIVLDHAHAVRTAMYKAQSPVTIVDTDFVTTQAFCEEYEGRTHPFVAACIDEFRFDYTLFLDNNTPWVSDGMRSLGSKDARERFESRLKAIYNRHNIVPHHIDSPDYFERYTQALAFIDANIFATSLQNIRC